MEATAERTRLVLTRKLGQSVEIGDVKVTLRKNLHKQFQLVIEAMPDVRILRSELLDEPKGQEAGT